MRLLAACLVSLVFVSICPAAQAQQITGAGGTFPAPVYAKWAEAARGAIGVDLAYSAVGSGEGQKRIIARSVDFGASDAPMDAAPWPAPACCRSHLLGAVVVIVNLPRVRDGELN